MDPEYPDFFAHQEASLEHSQAVGKASAGDAQDTEQAEFDQWVSEQFPAESQDGEVHGQPASAELQPQTQNADPAPQQQPGSTMAYSGYSPSAVPYDQQVRVYSPSAPPVQAYSPSNVFIPLSNLGDYDVEGSEMQDSRGVSQEARALQQELAATTDHPKSLPPTSDTQNTEKRLELGQEALQTQAGIPLRSLAASDSNGPPAASTPPETTPTRPVPPSSPRVTTNTQSLTPIQAAQARALKNRHDHVVWKDYLGQAESTGDLDIIRDAYEDALKAFPNVATIQIAYLNHYLHPTLFQKAEALFARFLRPSPSVELWKFYLTYVRRINTNTSDATVRDIVRKAYEFALSHVGHDMESGQIWRDYIDFLKNSLDSRTTWDAQQKMDSLRSAYHRAVVIPLDNVESLWRELDQYENGLNKITAKKFLQDLSPAYMTAKTTLRDLKRMWGPIATTTSSTAISPASFNLPPYPTWTNDGDRALAGAWKAYLKWEEGNPLDIDDPAVLQTRIISAYRKAVARMRFFPDITYMAFHSLSHLGKTEEAVSTLKQGMEANPSSFVLSFAYTEYQETQKNFSDVHVTFETLIVTLHQNLEDLEQHILGEVAAARASVLRGGGAEDASTPAVIEAEDRARKVRERRSKDLEVAKSELGLVWIMLMRFARRSEGLKPARTVFAKARKDKWCAWVVYEAAALMEYHCTKASDVATKIFEIGLKQFADNIEYVVRYLGFLISINDDNNARALFERTITMFPGEKGRPLWERWARYEYHFSDLAATQKLEQRIAEALPSNPPIKQFAYKFTYLNVDAIASRDLGFGIRSSPSSGPKNELAPTPTSSAAQLSSATNGVNKRAASPARRRDPSPPPSKRFKGNSPPPAPRGRDYERERVKDPPRRPYSPPRRAEYRREVDAIPEGVTWFMGSLPSATAFDGPKFRTEDLMHLFKTANLPHTGGAAEPRRSRSPPARGGRPPPDYGPYQGPGGSRGGRRY